MTTGLETKLSDAVLSIDELAATCARLRREGKSIAHCHGAFDLLHPGHIRHLQAAARKADVLVVTVTEDRYIKKGPGRPVYNERVRAESLAALSAVDYVATSPWPTGVETIELLTPDFYVKGQDYRDRADDSTGPIVDEKRAVERCGGRLVFTDEVQFSSTRLLDKHFAAVAPERTEYLDALWSRHTVAEVLHWLDVISATKALVIGDTIVEAHHQCAPISPGDESSELSVRIESTRSSFGGAVAVANHLAGLVGSVKLLSGVCHNVDITPHVSRRVEAIPIVLPDGADMRREYYRDASSGRLLFAAAAPGGGAIPAETKEAFCERCASGASTSDLTIVVNAAGGLIAAETIAALRERAGFVAYGIGGSAAHNVAGWEKTGKGADCICLDERTLRGRFRDPYGPLSDLITRLCERERCDRVCVTPAGSGAIYYDGESRHRAPSLSPHGDGPAEWHDLAVAIVAPLACAGAPSELIPFVVSCARAAYSTAACHDEPVSADALRDSITSTAR